MASNADLYSSIRIEPRGRKKKQEEAVANQCQWEGCEKPGGYKAPAGRNREGQYLNFCMDHVREYNKNFNYFNGLSDDEIAKFQKNAAQTGERPTWKMGTRRAAEEVDPAKLRATPAWHAKVRSRHTADGRRRPGAAANGTPVRKLKRLEIKALQDLGLKATASPEDVRAKYKELVKRYHPDANGGDRSSEERFRQIIQSYKQLKSAGLA